MIRVIGPRDPIPRDTEVINTTSRSRTWSKGLSPFVIGPCELYGGFVAKKMENAWQFLKLYKIHSDENGNPTDEYFEWAKTGWSDCRANRYPMGKGAKPLCSYWDGEKLSYMEARKRIYVPLYRSAVEKTSAFQTLQLICDCAEQDIYLWDFDGYDHNELGMSFDEVVNCETRKMGHAFVLYGMLSGEIEKYM